MKTYSFRLITSEATTEEQDNDLFDRFKGRLTCAASEGKGVIYLHLDAERLEDALRHGIDELQQAGFVVERVELDPEEVGALAA